MLKKPAFITLTSSDNLDFVVPIGAAKRSGFIARILYATTSPNLFGDTSNSTDDEVIDSNKINVENNSRKSHEVQKRSIGHYNDDDDDDDCGDDAKKQGDSSDSAAFTLPLPDIHSSVLDIIVQFLCEAENSYQNSRRAGLANYKPFDVSSALTRFDPNDEKDRLFVMELMMACDYLAV